MSSLDDAIAKAKSGNPAYYAIPGVQGLLNAGELTPQQIKDLKLIEQRGYGTGGLPLPQQQEKAFHIFNPVSGFIKFMNTGPSGKKEGRPKWNEEMDNYEDFIDEYHSKKSYIVPPQADQVAFYNEYLDRAKSLLNRETPDERYERNRKELEQPMTPRERIQRLREMELMRQQFPDIGGIV